MSVFPQSRNVGLWAPYPTAKREGRRLPSPRFVDTQICESIWLAARRQMTEEKIKSQLDLAKRLRAVDEDDVAERVLTTHLLPDLIGNLRSFAQQTFRCTKCGTKYRRITLTGKCTKWISTPNPHKCNNKLILTVSEGSVRKYLGIAQRISEQYNVSNYLRQRIEIITRSIDSMFPSRFKETTLEAFM